MPDLNLQDEGSLDDMESSEEQSQDSTQSDEESPKKGGGAAMIIVVVLAVLIVGGGGAFLLNKLGVIHIFGKKSPAPAIVQLQDQPPPQQQTVASQSADEGQAKMIDTPPLDEKGKSSGKATEKPAAKAPAKEKPVQAAKEMPAPAASGKLQDMKGEYTIQVSAWRDKEVAQEIVKRLEEAGYPAFAEDRSYKDGTWYTVRVGRYASRKDAEMAVRSFAEELKSNYWIDRARAK